MKLIVGLGNPSKKYEATRHNVGFWAADKISLLLCCEYNFKTEKKFNLELCQSKPNDIVLTKPNTFMNKSGGAIAKIVDYYKIESSDIIVICDDTYLEVGQARLRLGGQSGGHNGLESIISAIKGDFWRLRIGIGEQGDLALEDYVLQKMPAKDRKNVDKVIDIALKDMVNSIVANTLENKSYKI